MVKVVFLTFRIQINIMFGKLVSMGNWCAEFQRYKLTIVKRKAPEEQVRSTVFCALDGGYKRMAEFIQPSRFQVWVK